MMRHAEPDPLRPSRAAATEAWASRVHAGQEQITRLREVEDPADFYAPMARRFGKDPHRTDDPALEVLRSRATADDVWLDIGAGGGRYSLPLALLVKQVFAIDPSASMLEVLRSGMTRHDISNIDVRQGEWPLDGDAPQVDVALMAHVGYDIADFGHFLDAAEAAADRCIVVMRTGFGTRTTHALWREVHAELRVPYPMLPELMTLLLARGVVPEVTLADRGPWGVDSRDELLAASRRQLWLRPGSDKDRRLVALIAEHATERDGLWAYDWEPMLDGIVTWVPRSRDARTS